MMAGPRERAGLMLCRGTEGEKEGHKKSCSGAIWRRGGVATGPWERTCSRRWGAGLRGRRRRRSRWPREPGREPPTFCSRPSPTDGASRDWSRVERWFTRTARRAKVKSCAAPPSSVCSISSHQNHGHKNKGHHNLAAQGVAEPDAVCDLVAVQGQALPAGDGGSYKRAANNGADDLGAHVCCHLQRGQRTSQREAKADSGVELAARQVSGRLEIRENEGDFNLRGGQKKTQLKLKPWEPT